MKVAIIGYGKMGKQIEKILIQRNHQITHRLNSKSSLKEILENKPDVAIEFSIPDKAKENIEFCVNNNIPIVVGTTGWLNELKLITDQVHKHNSALLYTSNFSIGVNLFFKLNTYLAQLMNKSEGYKAKITEIHHTEKIDSPSGTAISLANQIISNHSDYDSWENLEQKNDGDKKTSLEIFSERTEQVPGTHIINYESQIDQISIKHLAKNRKGFALGAVLAAEFIKNKTGIFNMQDVLQLN